MGRGEGAKGFGVGRFGYAAFGDDGGDVAIGGDVEGGVRGVDVWRDVDAGDVRDFVGRALFDGNRVAGGEREIESGDGSGDVEGDIIFAREHGDAVGADFVRGVSIGGDAIGANDDGSDAAGAKEVADHVVCDERERNAVLMKIPSGEARAL